MIPGQKITRGCAYPGLMSATKSLSACIHRQINNLQPSYPGPVVMHTCLGLILLPRRLL